MSDTSVHPCIRTNTALVALARAVASGKGVSVPLHKEQGFIILTPDNADVKYTKAQAKALLSACHAQAKGATRYADNLPTNPKSALALVHNEMPLWAKALNASTSRYTEAGKAIRSARDQAKIEATGGWVHVPSGIVGPSKRKTASAAIRAEHGSGWFNLPNVDELRKAFRADCVMVKDQQATPAPVVAEAQTATVTKAVLVDRCKQLSLTATGTKAELQARIDAVPLAGQLGWHS